VALERLLGSRAAFDEPLARHTSLRVGGPADALARPASREELGALLELCRDARLPWWILGGGFNTLVRDAGYRGVAISLASFRALRAEGELVTAEAGVSHAALTRLCAESGRTGLEFGVGIPGTIGGWLRMNAGTREREVAAVAHEVEVLDLAGGARWLSAASLAWHYRELAIPEHSVVLGGRFRTTPDDPGAIRARMDALLAQRRATQPISERSCGSVFKNPPGDHAGRLIEAAGLKGSRAGAARISELHANFIVTERGASAADVLALIERAQETVARSFGVALAPEVRIVGEPA
jgi:UDP-N-acetylmuramate dehydrogenase